MDSSLSQPNILDFATIKEIFQKGFIKGHKIFIPDELILLIYKYYKPKFKIGQRVIRIYKPYIDTIWTKGRATLRNANKKQRSQNVVISGINYNCEQKQYFYAYDYYPASEGFCLENDLRALTKIEEKKHLWELPHDMEAGGWNPWEFTALI